MKSRVIPKIPIPRSAFGVVTVKDTGVGIPAEMLESVFEMFMQVDPSLERSHGGLGIGLTLVKRLVEMHGGSVHVRSDGPDRGSEFAVRLPILVESVREPQPRNEENGAPARRLRILIVDDNRDAARMLALVLEALGNEARTAHDGLEGVRDAEQYRPDVVLMDIGMPKLNGYEAARRIREQSWSEEIALVALTGWGQEEDRRLSRESGFDRHLVKPVEPAALQKLLAELRPKTAGGQRPPDSASAGR
jgi:CheY-like chemotaxis protein